MNKSLNSFDSDEIVIDLRTTCSKDEAAAKLLGWLRGPIYPKYIQVTTSEIQKRKNEEPKPTIAIPYKNPHGDRPFSPEPNPVALDSVHDPLPHRFDAAQLKNLHSLDCTLSGSLEAQLLELHGAALLEFDDAMVEPDLENKASAVEYWKKQIRLAAKYLRDIDDELSNDDGSILKIDKKASKEAGSPQLRLSSLDLWSRRKYGISIFEDDANVSQQTIEDAEASSEDGSLKKVAANNLYVTLAFFVDAFSKTATAYHSESGPTVIAIAKKIEAVAKAANGKDGVPDGQRHGAIKLRIVEAMKRKKIILNSQ